MRTLMILLLTALPARAGDLPAGAYRVLVETVLPNVATSTRFETRICWRTARDPGMPLGPLRAGPVSRCPGEAVALPDGVRVITACPGPNAGFAMAEYRRIAGGFRGVVSINLGGKNMTLEERQTGTWLGPC